ncbi:MAG: Na+/H+ antiporter NhaA [Planctomycetales bacterium]|nr:Na+/H+ antiporter NhaA [Planctomycetales bacterium]
MSNNKNNLQLVQRLQEFSIPLIAGVIVALVCANLNFSLYEGLVHKPFYELGSLFSEHAPLTDATDTAHSATVTHQTALVAHDQSEPATGSHGGGHESPWAHFLTMHFLVNDIFMVFFFGIAAKEITEACLPGGSLNPIRKAINPLFGTLGGVLGPAAVYLLLNAVMGRPEWSKGWGIPTATDIALAWLVARFLFGKGHAAVSFLLLLAVADDGIGLGIIAVAYPDPAHPTVWSNAIWIVPGMLAAFGLRMMKVQNWVTYIAAGGSLCWWGLYSAHLHPALALVFVVPFLPGPKRDMGLFVDDETPTHHHSPLEQFEHSIKLGVDFGLFFFAFANAGVPFSGITELTWIVLAALVVGKTIGIVSFSLLAQKFGFPLPEGMNNRHLAIAASVAGIGLTVSLFVSGQAFSDTATQGAAKMGALFSVCAPLLAVVLGKVVADQPGFALSLPWKTRRSTAN